MYALLLILVLLVLSVYIFEPILDFRLSRSIKKKLAEEHQKRTKAPAERKAKKLWVKSKFGSEPITEQSATQVDPLRFLMHLKNAGYFDVAAPDFSIVKNSARFVLGIETGLNGELDALNKLIGRLEDAGLILDRYAAVDKAEADPRDSLRRVLILTPAGQAALQKG